MTDTQDATDSRIAARQTPRDTPGGPSTPPGKPVDAFACTALNCHADQNLRRVTDAAGRRRVLCPRHAREFLDSEVPA